MSKTSTLMANIANVPGNTDTVSSQAFKQQIINDIQSHYAEDIKYAMFWKTQWHKISTSLHTTAEVLIILSVILAFIAASSVIGDEYVSICALVSGGLGVVSRSLELFSASTRKKSKKKTDELNELLAGIGIDHKVPDITNDYNSVGEGSREGSGEDRRNESKDNLLDDMNLGDIEMGFLKKRPVAELETVPENRPNTVSETKDKVNTTPNHEPVAKRKVKITKADI